MSAGVTAAACLAGAALGGLYLAFDLAVLPALDTRSAVPARAAGGAAERDDAVDATATAVMRKINVAIVRPSFLGLLLGAPALAVAAALTVPGPLTVGAALLQTAGLLVTLAVDVPRNDALARDHDPGTWTRFIGPWRRAHRIRTAATLTTAVLGALSTAIAPIPWPTAPPTSSS